MEKQGTIVLAKEYYPKNYKTSKIDENFENLLQQYADLWPKKITSGNRLIRRSVNSLKAKMKAFVNKRKDIPYKIILEATDIYLKKAKQNNWQFTISADYFISKNGSSELESLCDLLIEGNLSIPDKDNLIRDLN